MTGLRRLTPALVALVLLLSGCVGLPETGPILSEPAGQIVDDEAPVDFTPGGPQAGASPVEIVRGFLVAMQATPLNTSVARRFLTAAGSSKWVPENGTVVYTSETRTLSGDDVRLNLADTVELDERGSWLGGRGDAQYTLDLVLERGEWRIDNPPDRLIIPQTHFENRFHQHFLYFFDKTGEVLIPEPVYVPTGAQGTTFLTLGLLRGPEQDLLGVERTFIPARTTLDDLSVPVSPDGTVDVPLSDEVLDLDDAALSRAFAQLAWTLAQVPGVDQMRVTVDGSPLDLPGVGSDVNVSAWSEYDPAVSWASQSLFGVRDGRVVSVINGEERRVSGALGSLDLGLELVGVDLPGERVAATTGDGSVLVAPRSRVSGTVPEPDDVTTVFAGGIDLLRPVWDINEHLWLVDRTRGGAEVNVLHKGEVKQVQVDGVTGEDVRSFVLSRDGSRLAVEIAGPKRDRLVLARVLRDQQGRVRRLTPAEEIPLLPLGITAIRDLAWRTPGSLALLTERTGDTSQVVVVKVDGSSDVAVSATDAETFRGAVDRLVTSAAPGSALYIRTRSGQLFALASNGRWVGTGFEPGLESPTFVG